MGQKLLAYNGLLRSFGLSSMLEYNIEQRQLLRQEPSIPCIPTICNSIQLYTASIVQTIGKIKIRVRHTLKLQLACITVLDQ